MISAMCIVRSLSGCYELILPDPALLVGLILLFYHWMALRAPLRGATLQDWMLPQRWVIPRTEGALSSAGFAGPSRPFWYAQPGQTSELRPEPLSAAWAGASMYCLADCLPIRERD